MQHFPYDIFHTSRNIIIILSLIRMKDQWEDFRFIIINCFLRILIVNNLDDDNEVLENGKKRRKGKNQKQGEHARIYPFLNAFR